MTKLESFISNKFHFDAQYLFRGGFWIMLGHGFSILAVLATSYFFANFLDEQTYGNYRYLVSAATVLSLFSLTGFNTAVKQAAAKNVVGFFDFSVRQTLKYGLIISLISTSIAGYYFIQGNSTLALGLILIAIFQPLINVFILIFSEMMGKQEFARTAKFHFWRTLITTISIVSSIFFSGEIIVMFTAYLVSNMLGSGLVFLIAKNTKTETEDYVEVHKFFRYAKHTSFQNIFMGVANQLDKILIFQNLGAKDLAIYAFAVALPDQYKGATKTIETLLLPRFSTHSNKTIRSGVIRKTVIYFFILVLCAALYILIAPVIYTYVFPTYTESIFLTQIYAVGIIFGINTVPLTALKAQLKNRQLYKFKISTAIFQITSLVVLLFSFGLIGAIVARVLHKAFVCFLSFYIFYRSN